MALEVRTAVTFGEGDGGNEWEVHKGVSWVLVCPVSLSEGCRMDNFTLKTIFELYTEELCTL